jgi:hypothetical protein
MFVRLWRPASSQTIGAGGDDMRRRHGLALVVVQLSLSLTLVASNAPRQSGGRNAPPSGTEIAAAARATKLDSTNVGTATMFSKPFTFTPSEDGAGNLEQGVFLGVLENGGAGDETGLPPGRYNLFVASVAGRWRAYAEAKGQVVREAAKTTVTSTGRGGQVRPRFLEKGWQAIRRICTPAACYVVTTWW